jgi:predicted ATP-dependent endonuclease of OLD family
MSDIPLPLDRFSADTYLTALENLVERYVQVEEPVHYKKAAISLNKSTCSSCLKFFSEIGVIEAEKAGVYVPSKPVIDYFRKIGDSKKRAQKDIKSILDDYEVFSEALFLTETGEFDLEGLSVKVAGQLDIDKNNLGSVSTAIEIFELFGYLEISENGEISSGSFSETDVNKKEEEESEEKESEADEPEAVEQSLSGSLETETIDNIELPPTRGDPEGLLQLVDILAEGGVHSTESIVEDFDASKRKVQGITQYGTALGFVEKREEGYLLTDSGFELSFASSGAEQQELFEEAVSQYSSYRNIIKSSCSELEPDANSLDSGIIKKELRTTFGFRDVNDDTLRDAITTLLKSLEAAGFGEYKIGRNSNPTRLEATPDDIGELRSLVSKSQFQDQSKNERPGTPGSDQSSESDTEPSETEDDGDDTGQAESEDSDNTEADSLGPAIRISEVRLQNFRNIRDTGFVELENVTTLIGKNESGKTSTLEAINSFSSDYEYSDRDLSNSTEEMSEDEKIPIISLRFEIDKSLVDKFYPQISDEANLPLTITRTKFFDNSYESQIDAPIEAEEVELPTPNILYYDSYSLINDKATVNQLENGDRSTFRNLLNLGGLSIEDLEDSPLSRYNTIEQAQNRIEDQLNEAWSQKSLNINLNWNDSEETIHLLIQDQLDPDSAVDERPLTYPSQRSEGFKWFLSFYINLLSESSSSGLESKVLLLDDPAVYLHPEGKRDWLESVNEIGKQDQVVFSSHSPYLIDKRYPSRIRAVEDTPRRGTKIREDIFESDSRTLEPLRNALGVNLGSSPFISGRQLLVEGPTEYYVVAAVANYFTQELDRDLFGWQDVSVMPVRGASNVVGQASWLESEDIDFAIMLDSDEPGHKALERIRDHNPDITTDRVVLLQNSLKSDEVVTEDLFDPELYVSEFNDEYEEYTSELEGTFEPASIEEKDGLSWDIGGIEYDGSRLDKVLVEYLENSDVSDDLKTSRGEIELRKRQIAERIASRVNRGEVEQSQLEAFNRLFSEIDSAMDTGN